MGVATVISQLQSLAMILRMASHFPGLAVLALEADALENLSHNEVLIHQVFDGVEAGVEFAKKVYQFLVDNGLNAAAKYLTTKAD